MSKDLLKLYVLIISSFLLTLLAFALAIIYPEQQHEEQLGCGVIDDHAGCGTSDHSKAVALGLTENITGQMLFKQNCTSCHAINDVVVGPALKDVDKRRKKKWLYRFIKNSEEVIASGDTMATSLYEKYNNTPMTSFDFSDAQIDSILAYIRYESVVQ